MEVNDKEEPNPEASEQEPEVHAEDKGAEGDKNAGEQQKGEEVSNGTKSDNGSSDPSKKESTPEPGQGNIPIPSGRGNSGGPGSAGNPIKLPVGNEGSDKSDSGSGAGKDSGGKPTESGVAARKGFHFRNRQRARKAGTTS